MTQYDFGNINPSTTSGAQLATLLGDFRNALNTRHSGAARPSYAQANTFWVKIVSGTVWELYWYDGAQDILLTTLNPETNVVTHVINAGQIVTAMLADEAVTGQKIAPTAITQSKLATASVGTAQMIDAGVTFSKLNNDTHGTTGQRGILQLASQGDVTTGTDANKAVAPSTLSGRDPTTVTLAAGADKVFVRDATDGKEKLVAAGELMGLIQQVYAEDATRSSFIAATIPSDDTIPQKTEGTALSNLDVSITPTSATSKLEIEWIVFGSGYSAADQLTVALFVDQDADAIAVSSIAAYSQAFMEAVHGKAIISAASTSARTYKLRFGSSGGYIWYNGNGTERKFGGITKSMLIVREIRA